MGKEQAINLGVDYDSTVRKLLLGVVLCIAIATAMVGPISFLGLIIANLARLPCLTLPCGFVVVMPVAVNLMGRCFDEQTVLNCAYALESMMPYCQQYAKGE